jgi:hypothetical protein
VERKAKLIHPGCLLICQVLGIDTELLISMKGGT